MLPEDVWLTTLSSTSGTATPAPGADPAAVGAATFTINGFATSQADVAQLLSRLDVVPEFSNVQLTSSSRGQEAAPEGGSPTGDPQDFSFAIVATIAPEGEPAQ